jgi:hypothetical protein
MIEPSSFRDPSGFVFFEGGEIFRQINECYKSDYDLFMDSGLYHKLIENEFLIPHLEVTNQPSLSEHAYKTIKPTIVPFLSYPYEWCFSQFKDAALLTLDIQEIALDHGMTLKDASAYNIQFLKGKPIFIDTLSFEKYEPGTTWIAYRQFCQHFLAPLVIMKSVDVRLSHLLKSFIDGIPLDLAASLIPFRSKLNFTVFSNIVVHSKSQKHFGKKMTPTAHYKMSKFQHRALIDELKSFIKKLSWSPINFEWSDYYSDTNYSPISLTHKKEIVLNFIQRISPKIIYDIGGNIGLFSRLASENKINTICFDNDPAAVEKNYLEVKKKKETLLLPLILNITNPSPGIGWSNKERQSLNQRGKADAVLSLALIHHLAISNNIPLSKIFQYFSTIGKYCIIEWVPKEDSQVQRLLSTRKDIFLDYQKEHFENAANKYFKIIDIASIKDSVRSVYLMEVNQFLPKVIL